MKKYGCAVILQEDIADLATAARFRDLFAGADATARIGCRYEDGCLRIWSDEQVPEDALLRLIERKHERGQPLVALHALSPRELESVADRCFRVGRRYLRITPLEDGADVPDEYRPWTPYLVQLRTGAVHEERGRLERVEPRGGHVSNLFLDPIFLELASEGEIESLLDSELGHRAFVPPPRPVAGPEEPLTSGVLDPLAAPATRLRAPLRRDDLFPSDAVPAAVRVLEVASDPIVADVLREGGHLWFEETRTRRRIVLHCNENASVAARYRCAFLEGEQRDGPPWLREIATAFSTRLAGWQAEGLLDIRSGAETPPAEPIRVWETFGPDRESLERLQVLHERRERVALLGGEPQGRAREAEAAFVADAHRVWEHQAPAAQRFCQSVHLDREDLDTIAHVVAAARHDDGVARFRASLGLALTLFWPALSRWVAAGSEIAFEGRTAEAFFSALDCLGSDEGRGIDGLERSVATFLTRSLLVRVGPGSESQWQLTTGVIEPGRAQPDETEIAGGRHWFLAIPAHGGWLRALPFLQLLLPIDVRIVQAACPRESSADDDAAIQRSAELLGAGRSGLGYLIPRPA